MREFMNTPAGFRLFTKWFLFLSVAIFAVGYDYRNAQLFIVIAFLMGIIDFLKK